MSNLITPPQVGDYRRRVRFTLIRRLKGGKWIFFGYYLSVEEFVHDVYIDWGQYGLDSHVVDIHHWVVRSERPVDRITYASFRHQNHYH